MFISKMGVVLFCQICELHFIAYDRKGHSGPYTCDPCLKECEKES